jgi:LPS-assembly protein
MGGGGFFWAINRSYDMTYRAQYFSAVGLSHAADFRGIVNDSTNFNLSVYGLSDNSTNPSISTGGYSLLFDGKSKLGNGWEARGHVDLLSSLTFREEFSETLTEAIQSETHSVGFLTKHWKDYGANIVAERDINFQDTTPGNHVELRKLPEVEFTQTEHQVKDWPLWFSFDSSDGLETRSDPAFQNDQAYRTRGFDERGDAAPMLTSVFRWKGISILPSVGVRETFYGNSLENGQVTGRNELRSSRDLTVEVLLPSLERVFKAPHWMGEKVKHVIEPRVTYKYVTGIDNFNQILRFDQIDLVSNTNQVEFSLTNRLLAKDKNGVVSDALIWQMRYDRYLDPTFGGAVVPGQRNTVESVAELTGFTFLDGYRRQSPIVSSLRYQSKVSLEWLTDYDIVRHGFVDSNISLYGHISSYTFTAGESFVKTDPVLAPNANQLRGSVTYGNQNRRGWNAGVSGFYDYRLGTLAYLSSQVTYNTDCCGFSAQWRRLKFGVRDDNYYVFSLAISNIGTFGSLRRQDRTF